MESGYRRKWPLVLAVVWLIAAGPGMTGEHPLFRERPLPTRDMAAALANEDLPQQERVDAMSRMVRRTAPEERTAMADWLEAMVRDGSAPLAMRIKALRELPDLESLRGDLIAYLGACALEAGERREWRLACLTALGEYCRGVGADRDGHGGKAASALEAVASGEPSEFSAHAEIMLARGRGAAKPGRRSAVAGQPDDPESTLSRLILAAETGDPELLPLARNLVADQGQAIRLRLASIRLIGLMGDGADYDRLLRDDEEDALLRPARTNARNAILSRMVGGQGMDDEREEQ